MQLLIQARNLVVLDDNQLVQLVNLLLRVPLLPLVAFEHGEETVNAFIAGLPQIGDDSLTHFHLLLVVFELAGDLLGVTNQITQVLLLGQITLLNLAHVLLPNIDPFLLENALMLGLGH